MLPARFRARLARFRARVILGLAFILVLSVVPWAAAEGPDPSEATPAITPASPTRWPYRLALPYVRNKQSVLSERLGFGTRAGVIPRYPGVETLMAGWYQDWYVHPSAPRPNGMSYVQTVAVHQKLTCAFTSPDAHDRTLCPYAQPLDYVLRTDRNSIIAGSRSNPGSLWMIGNEMDRRDWQGGGQDETLPETYAVAYHDIYHLIKSYDPRARIAIGGVIQATPLRLEYLTKVWDTYLRLYGVPMPVDVWNVHNFILKENLHDYGASIPPGSDAVTGVLYPVQAGGDGTHVSLEIFDQQIRAFRGWMRDRGQQNKPLVVSEYGVLYRHIREADTAAEVQAFMIGTFDYFLNTKDCSLGTPGDDCRLVQAWAWYSLDDRIGFNPLTALFDPSTQEITSTGVAYREWSAANRARLGQPGLP